MKQALILFFTLAFLFVLLFIGLGTTNYATGEVISDEIIVDEVIISGIIVNEIEEVVIEKQNHYTIPRNDDWICFDYATAYMEDNPEFGILIITNPENHRFQRGNDEINPVHAVNYKFYDDKTMLYHDEMLYGHFNAIGWEMTQDNWYFAPEGFENSWDYLLDNKQETYNEL